MLNQVVLVGRLVQNIKVNSSEKGAKVATITLAIPRSFKNMEGNYDTDFINCILFESVATNTSTYCQKGDIIGVKGRVQSRTIEKEDKKETINEIVAEKVTFLSSKNKNDKEQIIGEETEKEK